jgi:hypothetical protein
VIWSCWDLKREVSKALTHFLGEHGLIDSMSITTYHIPNAVHPFIVPVPIEGHQFLPIEDPSVVNCIHQCAVLFLEKRNVKVKMKMKYNSLSMKEFPEISNEPMGGKSAKGDKGLGKDISAKSDLNLKHLICLKEHPSHHAPCIPV